MTTVVRSSGHRESIALLWVAIFLGLPPVAAYFTVPGTRLWAPAFGALLGLPLFASSLWLLGRCDVLRLSGDLRTFELIKGSFLSRKGRRFPADQVKGFHLEDALLGISMADGERLRMGVGDDINLKAIAIALRIGYTTSPATSISLPPGWNDPLRLEPPTASSPRDSDVLDAEACTCRRDRLASSGWASLRYPA